jgi:hypothetical protein
MSPTGLRTGRALARAGRDVQIHAAGYSKTFREFESLNSLLLRSLPFVLDMPSRLQFDVRKNTFVLRKSFAAVQIERIGKIQCSHYSQMHFFQGQLSGNQFKLPRSRTRLEKTCQ